MEPAAFSHVVKLIFVTVSSYKCIVLQCAVWATSVIEGSTDRRVNWMMDALLWLMGHFYSQFWVWVRSAVPPHFCCVHQSIISLPHFSVFSPCFSASFQPNTFPYSTLSYLCLHFYPFLWNLAVFTNDSVSSAALALFSWHLCPFSFCLVSSCLIFSWCFSFRQLMENKITTIERGAFQDLKELERLWVHFLSSNQVHFHWLD